MLVLSRSPGRGIYFGRTGWLCLDRVSTTGAAHVTITIDSNTVVSIGGIGDDEHARKQDAADARALIAPSSVARYEFRLMQGMALRVGRAGTIMVTEVVNERHVRFGFDLPNTEAVSRDDYSREWHTEQQRIRADRRPHVGRG
jgi:hypothetical protein